MAISTYTELQAALRNWSHRGTFHDDRLPEFIALAEKRIAQRLFPRGKETETELTATGSTARRGPQRDAALTSQETRVALFAAKGLTNREIAAALFLSPRTVEHHVTSVLRKRGLNSRVELAAEFAS